MHNQNMRLPHTVISQNVLVQIKSKSSNEYVGYETTYSFSVRRDRVLLAIGFFPG